MLVKFSVITLFPEALQPYLDSSMMCKAAKKGIAEFELINLRDFGLGPHKSVDDAPYGGGDGMLLRCEPAFAAVEFAKQGSPEAKVIIPTPGGELWTQKLAERFKAEILRQTNRHELDKSGQKLPSPDANPLDSSGQTFSSQNHLELDKNTEHGIAETVGLIDKSQNNAQVPANLAIDNPVINVKPEPQNLTNNLDKSAQNGEKTAISALDNSQNDFMHYVIFCPHYEGCDARILTLADYQVSLGKYILTGGELPALVMIDSIVRLLPGVLGGETSALVESFSDGDNLEYPQYTKPYDFRGMKVPDILLSGNHGAVDQWRADNSGVFGEQNDQN